MIVMHISDYDYYLPSELIAQIPIEPRDSARLLVVHRDSGVLEHRIFREIGDYLRPGDLLVVNQSRVLPARLRGVKTTTGGHVELLLLSMRGDLGPDTWEALARPGRRVREGERLDFGDGRLAADVLARTEAGGRIVRLTAREGSVADTLALFGTVPLPPYIRAPLADVERYQTVYARMPGSAAAPTAGLHFTSRLLTALEAQGIGIAYDTLHIGLDTFRPIKEDDLSDHKMHSEEVELDTAAAERINATRAAGGRIVAVGTTSVRVLESVAALAAVARDDDADVQLPSPPDDNGPPESSLPGDGAAAHGGAHLHMDSAPLVVSYRGRTSLFIQPEYRFRAVDAMITNFHLPRSTLLVLVSAFAGRELVLRAYEEAVARGYRFYSFGDAMLIV
jgi:S-adenosylmethionine:tRNA ribosyltransferase-isomerase